MLFPLCKGVVSRTKDRAIRQRLNLGLINGSDYFGCKSGTEYCVFYDQFICICCVHPCNDSLFYFKKLYNQTPLRAKTKETLSHSNISPIRHCNIVKLATLKSRDQCRTAVMFYSSVLFSDVNPLSSLSVYLASIVHHLETTTQNVLTRHHGVWRALNCFVVLKHQSVGDDRSVFTVLLRQLASKALQTYMQHFFYCTVISQHHL